MLFQKPLRVQSDHELRDLLEEEGFMVYSVLTSVDSMDMNGFAAFKREGRRKVYVGRGGGSSTYTCEGYEEGKGILGEKDFSLNNGRSVIPLLSEYAVSLVNQEEINHVENH